MYLPPLIPNRFIPLAVATALLMPVCSASPFIPAVYVQEGPSSSPYSSISLYPSPTTIVDPPVITPGPQLPPSPTQQGHTIDLNALSNGEYVVTLVNSHTAAIETNHVVGIDGRGVPAPTPVHDELKTLNVSETAYFAVPTNWAGRVGVWEEGFPTYDRATLLEGSFMNQGGPGARIALDVSYVDGFTVPVSCSCGGKVRLGCNANLHDYCPAEYKQSPKICINPFRDTPGLPIANFFFPCAALAYTYASDNLATVNGINEAEGCETGVTCCVGANCPRHPGQPSADEIFAKLGFVAQSTLEAEERFQQEEGEEEEELELFSIADENACEYGSC
ncbi:hypothetical protein F5Y16DRAFT_405534 [Xylariaceae sp. FL0255]|nr:hypothetical protein F5Y16DRAFT_405534 [Xylariaceae sp. FL0255]